MSFRIYSHNRIVTLGILAYIDLASKDDKHSHEVKFTVEKMKNNSVKGDVLAWGTGAYGRLGHGSPSDCLSPRSICSNQIDGRGVMCVSAGLYHSAIVTDDHGVYVFGTNATSCLGLGRGASTMTSSDDSAGVSDGPS